MLSSILSWFTPQDEEPRKTHSNILLDVNDLLYDEIRNSAFQEMGTGLESEDQGVERLAP